MTTTQTTADDLLYVIDTRPLDESAERNCGPRFDGNIYSLACPVCDWNHGPRNGFAFRNQALIYAAKHLATAHGMPVDDTLITDNPELASWSPMPDIRITVDGRPALTTEQAALRHGRGLSQMRTLFARYKIEPVAYLNPRMALYDEEQVAVLRPRSEGGELVGQGKGGGRKPRAE